MKMIFDFLTTYATEIFFCILMLGGIIGLAISRWIYVRTGPRQPSDEELLNEAKKAMDMSAKIAAESRENTRRRWRAM